MVALQQARGAGVPSAEFWLEEGLARTLTGWGSVISAGLVSVQIWRLTERLRTDRRRKAVHSAAGFLLSAVCEKSGSLVASRLAVHVWVPGRVGRPFRRREVLKRLTTFRIAGRGRSHIEWTIEKGALGRAWRAGEAQTYDLAPLRAAGERGQKYFESRKDEFRFGLTWDEYRQVRQYTAIFARPLYDTRRHVIGLVSVDSTQRSDAYRLLVTVVDDDYVGLAIAAVEGAVMELDAATREGADE